jgi:hypothetical protein
VPCLSAMLCYAMYAMLSNMQGATMSGVQHTRDDTRGGISGTIDHTREADAILSDLWSIAQVKAIDDVYTSYSRVE